MIKFFQRKEPARGVVMLNSNLPPRAEEFQALTKEGATLTLGKPPGNMPWLLKGDHPRWGRVEFGPMRDVPPPPADILRHVPEHQLSSREKDLAANCRSSLMVVTPASKENVLRDRKNLLGWMDLLLRDAEGFGSDPASQHFWSRANLRDECGHDADLDVTSLFTIHSVHKDDDKPNAAYWIHTHGLGALGAFDFDVVAPSEDFTDDCGDVFRALAFAAVEGTVTESAESVTLMHPDGEVRLVPADEFQRSAPVAERALREHDGAHSQRRAVVCDLGGSRLFGLLKTGVRASRFLRRYRSSSYVILFSDTATEMMSIRARQTRDVLAKLKDEFAEFDSPALVKIGFPTGGGGREHMWCIVEGVSERGVDATLLNEPFHVPGVHKGERRVHPWETLTDWSIQTPVGTISPRNLGAARVLRERGDEIRALMSAANRKE